MGLGFVNRLVIKPVNKKYVGLQENIICFHCGKTKQYCYTCSLRKGAMERNLLYVKQMWIRKDELTSTSGKWDPSGSWFPKLTLSYFAGQSERRQPTMVLG